MEKFYEINNIKVVSFQKSFENSRVDGYYGVKPAIKQLFYVTGGTMIDIFKDKYIKDIYNDGNMPEFYYNPVNYISSSMYTTEELKSGLISDDRLFRIYCELNSKYLSYEDIKNEEKGIYKFNNFVKIKRL